MEGIVNTIKDTFDTLTKSGEKSETETETETEKKTIVDKSTPKSESESISDKEGGDEEGGDEEEENVLKSKKNKDKKSKAKAEKEGNKKAIPSRISKFTKKQNKKNQNKTIPYEEALTIYLEEYHNYIYIRSRKRKNVDNLSMVLNFKKGQEKQCISCKRNVGTIFKYEGGIYSAMCGASSNSEPCSLDIRIKRSKIANGYERYIQLVDTLDIIKEDIIRLKLDFMFQFISEVDMVNAFDILRNKLKATQKELTNVQEERNANRYATEIHMANKSLYESIQTIQNYMKEYNILSREEERNGVIRELVTEYIDNLLPKLRSLRKLQNRYIAQELSNDGLPQTLLVKRNDIEYNETTNTYESKDEIMDIKGEVLSFIY